MSDLLIYTEKKSNRLAYTFDLIFGDLLGLTYELINDKDKFANHTGAKFSYGSQPLGDELFFESRNLLFEKGIELQPIGTYDYNGIQGFYSVSKQSAITFDVFASTFFMVSRYEEYLPSKLDQYGRFRGGRSLQHEGGFLEKPMVNYYAIELERILGERFPQLVFKKHKFTYLPTFDIDMAYSYLEKGFKRNLGGFLRSFIISDYKGMRERFRVLTGKQLDPFDTFDFIFKTCGKYATSPLFFILLGDQSKLDKNIPHTSKRFRKLISDIAAKYETGIHLSFKSHEEQGLLTDEIKRLEEITGKKIFRNRYHYLRSRLPDSYQRLIKYGITEDYSMGYGPRPGFRAGLCTPFYFYDLEREEATNLKIFPLSFMDATFPQYRKLNAEQSLEKIRQVMHYVEETGGIFMGIWHNSSFTETGDWKGWKNVFETITREATEIMTGSEYRTTN